MPTKKNKIEQDIIKILKRKFPTIFGKIKKNSNLNFEELDSLQKINLLMDIERFFKIKFTINDFEKIIDIKSLIYTIERK